MDKVLDYFIKELKITDNDTIVIGVSGGPDSMALLHLMIKLREKIKITIICAHINHNVRSESINEQKFVESICLQNNIIFETMTIKEYSGDNFHHEARQLRYDYFKKTLLKYKAQYLLTAHHGDDLIETVLMRIVRGASLSGYSGFTKVSNWDGYKIIRPLIHVTKSEIVEYCKNNKISYVIDKSNLKDKYTRNRFRKYIIPALKKEDANVHNKFLKFSKTLIEYNEYMDKQVAKLIDTVCPQEIINIDLFMKQDHLMQIQIINFLLEKTYQEELRLITDVHVELIYNMIVSARANATIYLPNKILVVKAYNHLQLLKEDNVPEDYNIIFDHFINLPNGKNIEQINESDEVDNSVCRLNSEEINLPLTVRTRHNGDKMIVKGMIGHKKINDIFIDQKISMNERNLWPVVTDAADNIIWLPGLKKSKFDKTKSERYDIILKYY